MASITYTIPVSGDLNSVADPELSTALTTLLAFANGGIDKTNLATSPGILKLVANSNHTIAFGTGTLTGPAGGGTSAPYSNILPVTHGLPATPVVIVPNVQDGNMVIAVVGTPGGTTFQVQSKEIAGGFSNGTWGNGSGRTSVPFNWIAIS
jgi:hypothetical protein